jgi:outer membrane autotransporter barrel domain-containing protein
MSFKNGSFKGNSIMCDAKQAYGGAAVVKSGKVVFEDVLFENNVATSKSGIATGGAILVDITTGITDNGNVTAGDVTFKITKDMTYSGNNVVGGAAPGDTYGWYAYTGGGFLFLDRASFGTFDIDEGKNTNPRHR